MLLHNNGFSKTDTAGFADCSHTVTTRLFYPYSVPRGIGYLAVVTKPLNLKIRICSNSECRPGTSAENPL